MTLDEFLLARVAEDEEVARAAIDADSPDRRGQRWVWQRVEEDASFSWLRSVEEFPTTSGVGPLPAFPLGYDTKVYEPTSAMPHIARHDPARVLAECAAKRAIVALHRGGHECSTYDKSGEVDNCTWVPDGDNCSTLRLLAQPHADHPDYDGARRS